MFNALNQGIKQTYIGLYQQIKREQEDSIILLFAINLVQLFLDIRFLKKILINFFLILYFKRLLGFMFLLFLLLPPLLELYIQVLFFFKLNLIFI